MIVYYCSFHPNIVTRKSFIVNEKGETEAVGGNM
jgi:hypothetical protein